MVVAKILIGIACILALMAVVIVRNSIMLKMIKAVNQKESPENQFDVLFWGPSKRVRFIRRYEELFPGGDDWARYRLLEWVGFGIMLCGVVIVFWL